MIIFDFRELKYILEVNEIGVEELSKFSGISIKDLNSLLQLGLIGVDSKIIVSIDNALNEIMMNRECSAGDCELEQLKSRLEELEKENRMLKCSNEKLKRNYEQASRMLVDIQNILSRA